MKEPSVLIIIITRGRIDRQRTLRNLPPALRELVTIVCHPGEKKEHQKRWGGQVADIVEAPADVKGIGKVRHWVIKHFGADVTIFMDDDLDFCTRMKPDLEHRENVSGLYTLHKGEFSPERQQEVLGEMFFWMIDQLSSGEYGMAGINARQNSNFLPEFEECTRQVTLWGVNKELYNSLPISLADFTVKEDFAITLAFLTNGIKTIKTNRWVYHTPDSNGEGGCSIYRTLEMSDKSAYILAEAFPKYVKVVERSNNNWGGEDFKKAGVRKEVQIQWKKAYEDGLKRRKK